MIRTGSYPLMNLAQHYGVDYGDVLVWSYYLRLDRVAKRMPRQRFRDMCDAVIRIHETVGSKHHEALMHHMVDHANARWGEPETEFAPFFR